MGASLGIARTDLVEKDLILHRLLTLLAEDKSFCTNFLFKGGTCLIKAYYGYKRFSEDIDFTWKNQEEFIGLSQKRIRALLSKRIDELGRAVEFFAAGMNLDFKLRKGDRRYVELTGSNKNCTFKIWYVSAVTDRESFIKMQVNFVETLCFRPKRRKLKGLLGAGNTEIHALFPEEADYSKVPVLCVYDAREILSEKIRTVLTRRGIKARDFLDAYLIHRELGVEPRDVAACASKKLATMLRLYARYRANLKGKTRLMSKGGIFAWGEEKALLLEKIDEKDFNAFVRRFEKLLKKVAEEVSS